MRLKMFSFYDFFPSHNYVEGEPYIPCYVDNRVVDLVKGNAIALLIEPRSLNPYVYEYIENNPDKFKLIFTHDSILLSTLPNAKHILYGGVWGKNNESQACIMGDNVMKSHYYSDKPKTKDISFCSSNKEMCFLHRQRKRWFKALQDEVDCMGTYRGGKLVKAWEIYSDYRFSVVIENYIDDFWFTEKICNAFAHKCVPIYYGAKKIDYFFDKGGIIRINNLYDLPKIIRQVKYDTKYEYGRRTQAIENNYNRVREFEDFEKWFFNRWGDVLEKLYLGELDDLEGL